jgi:hypothetical protein
MYLQYLLSLTVIIFLTGINLISADDAAKNAPAKAVIQIWLAGGLSHLDTFDPKPAAGVNYCGPYNKPLTTNVEGIQISQMLPLLAKQADKYVILRGMTHGNNGHETAAYLVQTGRKPVEGVVFPGIGATVTYFKYNQDNYSGELPPYITLPRPLGRFSESGFLGSQYKPFSTGGDPARPVFAVEGIVSEKISLERQYDRKKLLQSLDQFGAEMNNDATVKAASKAQEQAYKIILGDAGKTFDLNEESKETRERYGANTFGQSCLAARRLVERGVPYIVISSPGWDTHKDHFREMARKLPELDRGISALLQDLSDKQLLDSTIVWVSGEFGHTPRVQTESPWNGGRGHYGKAFSTLVAGGGFVGGKVVGQTDERGENVVSRPIYPWDLAASIYMLMGIPLDAKIPHPEGKQFILSPLAAAEIPANETGGILKEVMNPKVFQAKQ